MNRRTRSRTTPDSQRFERAEISEEITCDGEQQVERRDEKLEAQERNCECETGDGKQHAGVTRNINSHTRTETQWSAAAVTKKDFICEKISFTMADGRPARDLGDIDTESNVEVTWSQEGIELTRTIRKVENFKTRCEMLPTEDPSNTEVKSLPSTTEVKGPRSPICEPVQLKPGPYSSSKYDSEVNPGYAAFRFPMGIKVLDMVNLYHVRRLRMDATNEDGVRGLCRPPARGRFVVSSNFSGRTLFNLFRVWLR